MIMGWDPGKTSQGLRYRNSVFTSQIRRVAMYQVATGSKKRSSLASLVLSQENLAIALTTRKCSCDVFPSVSSYLYYQKYNF